MGATSMWLPKKFAATGGRSIGAAIADGVGELEEEGPVDGQAVAGGLFGDGVEVGHQPIALFNVMSADVFLLRPIGPDFVRAGAFGGVIAVDGLEGRSSIHLVSKSGGGDPEIRQRPHRRERTR